MQTRFAASLQDFAGKTEANIDQVLRRVALDIFNELVLRSPVDTGRFRGAWEMTTDGALIVRATLSIDKLLTRIPIGTVGVERIKAGTQIVITNGMPYGPRLEYGWSDQAPQGFVRLTLIQFSRFVMQAARDTQLQ